MNDPKIKFDETVTLRAEGYSMKYISEDRAIEETMLKINKLKEWLDQTVFLYPEEANLIKKKIDHIFLGGKND